MGGYHFDLSIPGHDEQARITCLCGLSNLYDTLFGLCEVAEKESSRPVDEKIKPMGGRASRRAVLLVSKSLSRARLPARPLQPDNENRRYEEGTVRPSTDGFAEPSAYANADGAF
jgi:hypothetical protein